MRAHYLQHVPFEGLGSIETWLHSAHASISATRLYEEAHFPALESFDLLIIMGGPMSVNDEDQFPWLRLEKKFIRQSIKSNKAVLGICLGAQLLAHVLGAAVPRNPVKEIGWYPLHKTDAGTDDAVLAPLQAQTPVFQWHGCRFDIPKDAVHLARSADCEQQAFRYGDNAYGFQFHLEMDERLVERWLATPAYREELADSGLPHDEAAIRAHTRQHIVAMQQQADAVFNNFLDLVGRPERRYTLPSREWA